LHQDLTYKEGVKTSSVKLVLKNIWFGQILSMVLFICHKQFINANVLFAEFIPKEINDLDSINVH
jgi:hypothetical protein